MSPRAVVVEKLYQQLEKDPHDCQVVWLTEEEFENLEADLHPAERFVQGDSEWENLLIPVMVPSRPGSYHGVEVRWRG